MNLSKKALSQKILEVLNAKGGELSKPGRLLPDLQNELKLTGGKGSDQIKESIAEALEDLSDRGLVILTKRGNIYDGVKRTARQRSIRQSARSTSTPSTKKEPVATPAQTAQHDEPRVEFAVATPDSDDTVSAPEPTKDDKPALKPRTSKEIIAALAARLETRNEEYETLQGQLENERIAHGETTHQKSIIAEAKRRLEEELGRRDNTLEEVRAELGLAEEEIRRLQDGLSKANQGISEGLELLEGAEGKLREAIAERERLEQELEEAKRQRDDEDIELAQRVANLLA